MTKNVSLSDLDKCKSSTRCVYFQNEIGSITDNHVIFNKTGLVLNCNEIAFVETINFKKNYNKPALLSSAFIIIASVFLLEYIPLYLLFVAAVIPLPLLFLHKNVFYIKIVKCEIKQVIIPIGKEQHSQAREFVNKIAVYRHFNPEIPD